MLRARTTWIVTFTGALVVAGLLPATAQASRGICLGRPVTLTGTLADDPLRGTAGDDVLAGLDGDDVISGLEGDDRMCGGNGNDVSLGNAGDDVMRGNGGNDVLVGGIGSDGYSGGPGTDICDVNTGDTVFEGCEADLADDTDSDGMPNGIELGLGTDPFTADSDGDGAADGDEVAGGTDPLVPTDADADGIPDLSDNCADAANADQRDLDEDELGDACDLDDDGDGFADAGDNCRERANDQADLDGDGLGDACDPDGDGDLVDDVSDFCPRIPGAVDYLGCVPPAPPVQEGPPDAPDLDTDGVPDSADNCVGTPNPDQIDDDDDGIGDACDRFIDLPDPGPLTFEEFVQQFGPPGCLQDPACVQEGQLFYFLYLLTNGYLGGGGPCGCIGIGNLDLD